MLYAALQPLCCDGFSTLISHLCTTLIRRRRRKFRRFEWRRFPRRFIRRIQFFKQFRGQPQFRRLQFERSQFKRIEFAWIERARFDIILFPLQRKYVSFE